MNQKEYILCYYDINDSSYKEIVKDTMESIDELTSSYTRDSFIEFAELDKQTIGSKFIITNGEENHIVFFQDDVKNYKETLKKIVDEELITDIKKNKYQECLSNIINNANNMQLRKMIQMHNEFIKKENNESNYEYKKI